MGPLHSALHGNNLKARNVGKVHVDFRGWGQPHTSEYLTHPRMHMCDYLQEKEFGSG